MATSDFNIPFEHRKPFAKHYQQFIWPLCKKLEARRGPIVARQQARMAEIRPFTRLIWPMILLSFGSSALGFFGVLPTQWIFIGFGLAFVSMLGKIGRAHV